MAIYTTRKLSTDIWQNDRSVSICLTTWLFPILRHFNLAQGTHTYNFTYTTCALKYVFRAKICNAAFMIQVSNKENNNMNAFTINKNKIFDMSISFGLEETLLKIYLYVSIMKSPLLTNFFVY